MPFYFSKASESILLYVYHQCWQSLLSYPLSHRLYYEMKCNLVFINAATQIYDAVIAVVFLSCNIHKTILNWTEMMCMQIFMVQKCFWLMLDMWVPSVQVWSYDAYTVWDSFSFLDFKVIRWGPFINYVRMRWRGVKDIERSIQNFYHLKNADKEERR